MILLHVNFNAYNNYITDSLYQWDKNHDLVIKGLGLSVAPEIHFANANMDRAIVKQSTLENGVITVRIPNSLLQVALDIKAYVGLYEGETFRTIEVIEIPILAKEKPFDYTIEDDEETYSFNALENKINNTVEAAIERQNEAVARYLQAVEALENYKNWSENSGLDVASKIDKVLDSAENNIVVFDANGGIMDSGENMTTLAQKIANEIAGGAW